MVREAAVDALAFRSTLSQYPTGVVVITALLEDGSPEAMVVGTFSSVSLDPPMVGFLPARTSRTFERMRGATRFCANVLAADQADLGAAIATATGDKLAAVDWQPGENGSPRLADVLAWIEFDSLAIADAGDHYFVTGHVRSLESGRTSLPLIFFQGDYGRFTTPEQAVALGDDLLEVVRLATSCQALLDELQLRVGFEASLVTPIGTDLVVVATGTSSTRVRVGSRFPFRAPMGAILVDPEDDAQLNRWLHSLPTDSDEERRRALAKLLLAHERGWSLALRSQVHEESAVEAWRHYSSDQRTPAQEREFRALLAAEVDLYEPDLSASSGGIDLRSLVAAVETGNRHRLGVRLSSILRPQTPAEFDRVTQALAEVAARMGEHLCSRDLVAT